MVQGLMCKYVQHLNIFQVKFVKMLVFFELPRPIIDTSNVFTVSDQKCKKQSQYITAIEVIVIKADMKTKIQSV